MATVVFYRGLPIEWLRPIAEAWAQEANGNVLGIEIDVDRHLADLQRLADSPQSLLLVLMDPAPIGYLGIEFWPSPLGHQLVASEHYWYVKPDARGRSSLLLIKEARRIAAAAGAAYMLFSASRLASDLHDSVCRLYEHMGMVPFETTYLCPLASDTNAKGDQ